MSSIANAVPTVETRIAVTRLPDGLRCELDIFVDTTALVNLNERLHQAKARGADAEIIEALEAQVSEAQGQLDTAVEKSRELAYNYYRKLGRA